MFDVIRGKPKVIAASLWDMAMENADWLGVEETEYHGRKGVVVNGKKFIPGMTKRQLENLWDQHEHEVEKQVRELEAARRRDWDSDCPTSPHCATCPLFDGCGGS